MIYYTIIKVIKIIIKIMNKIMWREETRDEGRQFCGTEKGSRKRDY